MNTENIIAVFEDYLKSDTNQALLINGKWGSGKTFFWKNTLSKIADKKKIKIIYISLNGIGKIENLEHSLFLKLIPFINNQENKLVKNTTKLFTNIADRLSSHYLKVGIKDIFKDLSIDAFDFNNYIICFDDLERCQISIKEVFGFINNFVEHKKLKTIILADENEIKDEINKIGDYKNIKEKLVGRILQYQPEIDKTLLIFFEKYKNDFSFFEFLNQQKEYTLSLLKEYKVQNLRTVSFYLDVLKRLFHVFENEKENRKKEILLFSLIISIQFKNGKLQSLDFDNTFDYEDVHEFNYRRQLFKDLNEDKANNEQITEKTNRELIYEEFLQNRTEEYSFFNSIYRYILSGYLDEKLFKNELKEKSEKDNDSPEYYAFTKLINYGFRSVSNGEFESLFENLIEFSKEGFYSIYEYQNISSFLLFFSENKLISLDQEEIEEIIKKGLAKSAEKKIIDSRTIDNMFHWEAKDENDEKVRNQIKYYHDKIDSEQNLNEINNFIEKISNNQIESVDDDFKWNFFTKLFKYVSIEKIFTILISSENKNIRQLTSLFNQSFKYHSIQQSSENDLNYIIKLENDLQDFINQQKNINVKIFLLKEFVEELEKIKSKISKK